MLLIIDLGNTNLTLGLYEGSRLLRHWRLATDHERMPDEYGLQLQGLLDHARCNPASLDGIVFSSVVPQLTSRVVQACRQYLDEEPLVVTSALKTGLTIRYDPPTAVGTDRIADAVALKMLYGVPGIVVDFGTATTFNAVNRDGEYLGGAIMAGVNVALTALTQRAAKLAPVELTPPPTPIGRNTVHALQSGLLNGYAAMAEGMVSRFKAEIGTDAKVVATGGLAETVAPLTSVFDAVAPWLTLDGLRLIWEMNRP